MFKLIILCSILLTNHGSLCEQRKLKGTQIKDVQIQKCDNSNYPLLVDNVEIKLEDPLKVKVAGTMNTTMDLLSPLQAKVKLWRWEYVGWIPLPCVDGIGSCTYNDLCTFGYPKSKLCPKSFLDNNVPCRCPIPKGSYTILPEPIFVNAVKNLIYDGKYTGNAVISYTGNTVTCYKFSFTLYNSGFSSQPSVVLVK